MNKKPQTTSLPGFCMETSKLPSGKEEPMNRLQDTYDRKFQYLRLSVTEACNFRCSYCLPNGYKKTCGDLPLSEEEIILLLKAFSELGITKVRLTGGEPTVRQDVVSLVAKISQLDGIEKIALTTNGHNLEKLALPLYQAGLTNLNLSMDSLDEDNFRKITGRNLIKNIIAGLESCLAVGIPTVKINTVLLKDLNDIEIPAFVEFVRKTPISIRFIELMQTGHNHDYFTKHHLSTEVIDRYLRDRGWKVVSKQCTDGPASEFSHPEYLGRIGMIAPYSKDFCKSCNRLRVSSKGGLQLCLFGEGQINLRGLLVNSNQKEELKQKIINALFVKPQSHDLQFGFTGITKNLSMIGG